MPLIVSRPSDLISLIAQQREENGYTLRDLASASGLAHPTICNAIERGDMKLSTALAYMSALGFRMEIVRDRRQ